MSKQTAVDWLLQELDKVSNHPTEAMIMYAKKLEKEQSRNDYYAGLEGFIVYGGGFENYYNETYGQQETNSGGLPGEGI